MWLLFQLDTPGLKHDIGLFLSMEEKYKINFTVLESSKQVFKNPFLHLRLSVCFFIVYIVCSYFLNYKCVITHCNLLQFLCSERNICMRSWGRLLGLTYLGIDPSSKNQRMCGGNVLGSGTAGAKALWHKRVLLLSVIQKLKA